MLFDLQSRSWCLTLNNFTLSDQFKLEQLAVKDSVLYLSAQSEVSKQGTSHIQAYIEWSNPLRFCSVKSMFPSAHIEKSSGTSYEAFQYCLKHESRSEDYWSVQSFSVPKVSLTKQVDWYELCCTVSTLYEFSKLYERVYIRNKRYVNDYYLNTSRISKLREVQVFVLVGDTGIGKTSYVYDNEDDVYVKDHTQWWDGYVGQPVVLIDEYNGQWSIEYLLLLLQGRPMNLQVKGGYVSACFSKVYLTSNFNFCDWYSDMSSVQLSALKRRIFKVLTSNSYLDDWVEL